MKRSIASLAILSAAVLVVSAADSDIRLNSIGYFADAPKQATLGTAARHFSVIRVGDGASVLEGGVTDPVNDPETKQDLFTADFSRLTTPGEYVLKVDGVGDSPAFRIGTDLYQLSFQTVTRAMYLWRCGIAVNGEHEGSTFTHEICHANDASLEIAEGRIATRASPGGWHDAGDYNRYVVNAGITVGSMFRAWEDFGPAIRRISLDIPESGKGIPDYLAELKWELDWLFTMQRSDGSVYHKLSTKDFCGFIMPEQESGTLYFAPWSSAATADFTAMMAAAARIFREFDSAYADRCLKAAQASHSFLASHPENHNADLSEFKTGAYATSDADDRLWAAAELWETTGDAEALKDFEVRARDLRSLMDVDFDWPNVKNLGLITYAFSTRAGRDQSLLKRIRESMVTAADRIVQTRNEHAHHRPLGTRYYWGCNGGVARQVMVLYAAHRVSPKKKYCDTALDALNHLFGRNPYGRSYVTGLGHNPPMHPHDRRSGADDVEDPWPGYLVGGPHRGAMSWEDEEENYRCNEIAINWNGALIYALSAFLDEGAWNESEHSSARQVPLDGTAPQQTAN